MAKSYNVLSLGKWTAITSFAFGTILFFFYYFTSSWELMLLGYLYVIFTVIVHIVVLSIVLVRSKSDSINRLKYYKVGGLMILNVPIAIIYTWLAFTLTSYTRISFENVTENKITNIETTGCEIKRINSLEAGESQTLWIAITRDCSINITYSENGEIKKELVAGYITNGMGQRLEHKIGGENFFDF